VLVLAREVLRLWDQAGESRFRSRIDQPIDGSMHVHDADVAFPRR